MHLNSRMNLGLIKWAFELRSALRYVHYGHKSFDPALFREPKNELQFNKPSGGFWASPVGAERSWKDWCEANDFRDCEDANSFTFSLTDEAKVYHIYCKEDAERLPVQDCETYAGQVFIDFEKAATMYDAIQFHLSDEKLPKEDMDSLYWVLYGWDCDSILILNKDVVLQKH